MLKTSHGACARMEKGNVTKNLHNIKDLFPHTKEGCKIDCELSPRTFFCYKRYQYRGVFLNQSNIYYEAFCEVSDERQYQYEMEDFQ